ncbi:hypothetical protein UlMin_004090 [Ulmus minor]
MSTTLNLSSGANSLFSQPGTRLFPANAGSASSARMPGAGAGRFKASIRASLAMETPPRRISRCSLYEILLVKQNASPSEIKTAYRSLAKLYHPDVAFSSEESDCDGSDFIEIHNAYATLSDPSARALYDLSLGAQFRRSSPLSSSYSSSGYYSTRNWETDQCW